MSYCVNCGVELEEGTRRCPLCATPVINPNELKMGKPQVSKVYSEKIVLPKQQRRRFTAFIATLIMLIPNLVCPLVNIMVASEYGFWAIYVNAASLALWAFFILPFLWKKTEISITILLDTLISCISLYLVSTMFSSKDWYFKAALPMILLFASQISLYAIWIRHKRRDWPYKAIAILVLIALTACEFELLISKLLSGCFSFIFSLVIGISCAIFILFFIMVLRHKNLRTWITRKFFI